MATTSNSEPVVVFYKSSICRHCTLLNNIWATPPSKTEDSVVTSLKKVHSQVRTFVVTAVDNSGQFNENEYPKDLRRYAKWFPMVLLIPGPSWDAAMSKLGPKNDVQLFDGVQAINSRWEKGEIVYSQKYDIKKPTEFGRWLKDSLSNEEFKKVQNVPPKPIPAKPMTQILSQQPLLTPIVKQPPYIQTEVGKKGEDRKRGVESHGDICSMRIISRPPR